MQAKLQDILNNLFPAKTSSVLLPVGEEAWSKIPKEEQELLTHDASEKRKQQFASGRLAAHHALLKLSQPKAPLVSIQNAILRGNDKVPIWPSGICGSISHSGDWALACVALTADFRSIGIDLEPVISPRRHDIASKLCLADELDWINAEESQRLLRLTMIFSAKEAIYKAYYPIYRTYFGFKEAELCWDKEREVFRAQILKSFSNQKSDFECEISVKHNSDFVVAFIALPGNTAQVDHGG